MAVRSQKVKEENYAKEEKVEEENDTCLNSSNQQSLEKRLSSNPDYHTWKCEKMHRPFVSMKE